MLTLPFTINEAGATFTLHFCITRENINLFLILPSVTAMNIKILTMLTHYVTKDNLHVCNKFNTVIKLYHSHISIALLNIQAFFNS